MDKGTRVRVVKGRKHKEAVGTVFWTGPDKYNEGVTRLGLHADDGETIWVRGDYCEVLDPEDPDFEVPVAEDPPKKGERVRWTQGEDTGSGEVFWVGESKAGPGIRVGLEDDESGETMWFDARQLERLDAEEPDEVPF